MRVRRGIDRLSDCACSFWYSGSVDAVHWNWSLVRCACVEDMIRLERFRVNKELVNVHVVAASYTCQVIPMSRHIGAHACRSTLATRADRNSTRSFCPTPRERTLRSPAAPPAGGHACPGGRVRVRPGRGGRPLNHPQGLPQARYQLISKFRIAVQRWTCRRDYGEVPQDTRPPTEGGPGSSAMSHLLLAQPHVLQPSVHPVAGHGLVVAEAR